MEKQKKYDREILETIRTIIITILRNNDIWINTHYKISQVVDTKTTFMIEILQSDIGPRIRNSLSGNFDKAPNYKPIAGGFFVINFDKEYRRILSNKK